MTIAVAPFGLVGLRRRRRAPARSRAWIAASIVSLRSWPCWPRSRSCCARSPCRARRRITARSPFAAPSRLVVGGLEPGQALAVGPDGPDHLGRELALRIDPPARRAPWPIPAMLELADLLRGRQVHLAGQVGEARGAIGEAPSRISVARDVQDRREPARRRRAGPSPGRAWRSTSAASSETASSRPLRSRILPRCPGIVTVWVCWLWASALRPRALHALTQAARPIARQNSSRKQANRRPIRRSITAYGAHRPVEGWRRGRGSDRRVVATGAAGRQRRPVASRLAAAAASPGFGSEVGRSSRAPGRSCRGSAASGLERLHPRRPAWRDLPAEDRDLALQGVGLLAVLLAEALKLSARTLSATIPTSSVARSADPQPAAGEPVDDARLREARDRAGRPADRERARAARASARAPAGVRPRGRRGGAVGRPRRAAGRGTRAASRRRGGGGAGCACRGEPPSGRPSSPPVSRAPRQLLARAAQAGGVRAGVALDLLGGGREGPPREQLRLAARARTRTPAARAGRRSRGRDRRGSASRGGPRASGTRSPPGGPPSRSRSHAAGSARSSESSSSLTAIRIAWKVRLAG